MHISEKTLDEQVSQLNNLDSTKSVNLGSLSPYPKDCQGKHNQQASSSTGSGPLATASCHLAECSHNQSPSGEWNCRC